MALHSPSARVSCPKSRNDLLAVLLVKRIVTPDHVSNDTALLLCFIQSDAQEPSHGRTLSNLRAVHPTLESTLSERSG